MPKLQLRPRRTSNDGEKSPVVASPSNVENRRRREARIMLADLRSSPKLKVLIAFCVGLLVATVAIVTVIGFTPVRVTHFERHTTTQITHLNSRVDQFASSCSTSGTCKTFPFNTAEQAAVLYAYACFNYTDTAPEGEQAARLAYAGGPKDCGMRAGTGSAIVFPDSSLDQNVPDAQGKTRDDLGVVGVKVWMAGQPEPISYAVPVKVTPSGLKIESAGAFYTTAPNTSITSCEPDSTSAGTAFLNRIQSLEAGRVRQPHIDPNDYVVPGMSIAKFGPSITGANVTHVTVCRGGDSTHQTVIADEDIQGPVKGSQFSFKDGYKLTKINGKWFVAGWGRPIVSDLADLNY